MSSPVRPGRLAAADLLRLLCLFAVVTAVASLAARPLQGADHEGMAVDFDWYEAFASTPSGRSILSFPLVGNLARSRLDAGWAGPRQLPDGEEVMVAKDRRSGIHFEWEDIVERELEIHCAAPWAEARRPRAMVNLNGQRLGILRASASLESHIFPIPVASQRVGDNRLELVNPRLRMHRRSGSTTRGEEGMACSAVAIRTPGRRASQPANRVHSEGGRLILPPGGSATAYARAGEEAPEIALVVDGPARLRVRDERGRRISFAVAGRGEEERWPLRGFAGRIVELRLEAGAAEKVGVSRAQLRSVVEPAAPSGHGDVPKGALQEPALIVLLIVDTLRADHLGLYGYGRDTSPNLDRLGAESLVFTRMVAQSSWTTPATGSILTGQVPRRHGAEHLSERMRADAPVLAGALRDAGWRTGGFVTNTNARGALGFARGFDEHRLLAEDPESESVYASFDELVGEALAWLDQGDDRPTFLYLHPSDPHGPYAPPAACRDRFAPRDVDPELRASRTPLALVRDEEKFQTPAARALLVARYDEEIACLDEAFGRLRAALEERGLFEDAIVVVTSDHGEEFFDHGHLGHGRTLFGEQLNVPLILRWPGYAPGRRRGLARQVDIAPTLLHGLGLAGPGGATTEMDGHSLLGGQAAPGASARTFLGGSDVQAHTTATHRYVRTRVDGELVYSAFALEADPHEQHSVAGANPVRLGWLRQHFASEGLPLQEMAGEPRTVELDVATRDRLEALGYVSAAE